MNQGIIAVILSIIFYLTSLLGGSNVQTTTPNYEFFQTETQPVSSVMGKRALVLGDKTTLRSGPDVQYPSVTAVQGGTEVIILHAENGWYKVRYAPGRDAWVAGSSVALLDAESEKEQQTMVLGYYFLDDQSFVSMLEHGQTLTSISPWAWAVTETGSLVGHFDPRALGESLLFAGNHGLKTYALIHSTGPVQMEALLTDPVVQNRAIANIQSALQEWGVHGAHLYLTDVPPALKDNFTAFTARLAQLLARHGLETSLAVPATALEAYDYAALGECVDFVVVLAYDQHNPQTVPGPVASATWVEEVVQYAVSQLPPEKLVLAIPNFGYHWRKDGQVSTITHREAVDLAAAEGVKIRWHSEHKTPYLQHDGGEAWFENRFSVQAKLHIAEEYGLKGIALWPLGQEDAGVWKLLEQSS